MVGDVVGIAVGDDDEGASEGEDAVGERVGFVVGSLMLGAGTAGRLLRHKGRPYLERLGQRCIEHCPALGGSDRLVSIAGLLRRRARRPSLLERQIDALLRKTAWRQAARRRQRCSPAGTCGCGCHELCSASYHGQCN